MIRLYSYSVYIFLFFVPFFFIALIVSILVYASPKDLIYTLFYSPVFAVWIYMLYKSKRIYYDKSEIYLYNLFSNKLELVKQDQGISIEKRNVSVFGDTGTYKLTYWTNRNKVRSILFAINGFLDNPDEIIDKINSGE